MRKVIIWGVEDLNIEQGIENIEQGTRNEDLRGIWNNDYSEKRFQRF